MLTRAKSVLKAIESELAKHERAIEVDDTLTKINVTVLIGRRTGNPVKVLYTASSESDLVEEALNSTRTSAVTAVGRSR